MDRYIEEEVVERNGSMKKPTRRIKPTFLYVGALIVVALSVYFIYNSTQSPEDATQANTQTSSFFQGNQYYAIFLDNNDVYFGKISKRDDQFITLENTFYLRVTQVPQKTSDGKNVSLSSFDLIKVGTEVHKPKDKVQLQVSHIISLQELDETSEVIKVINNYKAPAPTSAQPQ